jgi:hypothetical protein
MRTLSILFITLSLTALSQNDQPDWTALMNDPNANVFEIEQLFQDYWEGKTREKGDGYKPVMRWLEQAKKRAEADGSLRSASEYVRLYDEVQEYTAARSLEGN